MSKEASKYNPTIDFHLALLEQVIMAVCLQVKEPSMSGGKSALCAPKRDIKRD